MCPSVVFGAGVSNPGVQPVGESWSEDCLLALQRRVSNRILHIEIQGAHEGKALVTMIDESSDPQANIAELLISACYAAPCAVTTDNETAVTAEAQGMMDLKVMVLLGFLVCLGFFFFNGEIHLDYLMHLGGNDDDVELET